MMIQMNGNLSKKRFMMIEIVRLVEKIPDIEDVQGAQ